MTLRSPPRPVVLRSLSSCLEQIQRGKMLRRSLMGEVLSIPADNPLLQPLLDAVALFSELQIPYALIGGIAAMVYGRARFTDDVDFAAAAGHQEVLATHGETMRRHHFDPSSTWKLYHESGVEIDIWKDRFTDGIAERAREIELGVHRVRVADVHDLVAMKLRAGRLQDDYDIGEIVRAGGLADETLRSLVSADEFERFVQIRQRVAKQ